MYGDFEDVSADHESVYAYVRTSSQKSGEKWIVSLNFSGAEQSGWALPEGLEIEAWVGEYI